MKKLMLLSLAALTIPVVSLRADDAKTLFEKDCAKCHGTDGKGATKMGQRLGCKDYTDAKVVNALKDADAIKAIKEGLKNSDGKTLMKPSEGLSDEDLKGLVAYLKAFAKR